jgi:uncharacterized membrane protein YjjP (DUF1212 family)
MQLITLYSFVCIHTPSPSGDAVNEKESADPSIMLLAQRLNWAISQHSFSATGREKVVNVVSYDPKKYPTIFLVFAHDLHTYPSQCA